MIPEEFRAAVETLPAPLRALLNAELAAGNQIRKVGRDHPAPPGGTWIALARPVSTRRDEASSRLVRTLRPAGLTDADRRFFVLDPSDPPQPPASAAGHDRADTPLRRFERSMQIDYERWHDGIGYDLDALRAASTAERVQIEALLLPRATEDWRDIEALAALDTPRARAALRAAAKHSRSEIRLAVRRYAPALVTEDQRTAALIAALEEDLSNGLSEALDEIAEFHPPEIVAALLKGALHGPGENAVHFAAMLMYLHGQAEEPFDWDQRPFFLRFNTEDRDERATAFRELCARIGRDPADYLSP